MSFCDNADDDYEEDVEVDSESEQDDKARRRSRLHFKCFRKASVWLLFPAVVIWQGKEKKKVTETESYTPPTITLEHEESVFFVEPFAKRSEFESR